MISLAIDKYCDYADVANFIFNKHLTTGERILAFKSCDINRMNEILADRIDNSIINSVTRHATLPWNNNIIKSPINITGIFYPVKIYKDLDKLSIFKDFQLYGIPQLNYTNDAFIIIDKPITIEYSDVIKTVSTDETIIYNVYFNC